MKLIIRLVTFSIYFGFALGQFISQDVSVLLEFKKWIKYDPTGYVLQSWNENSTDSNACPASWNGIKCNGGNVAGVILNNLGLSADVDLSVFANLTMLVKLSIANNAISGKFPSNIADFKSLELFDVSNNLFTSTLPPEVGKSASLRNLSLAGNHFSGVIPDTLLDLTSIQSLDLSCNSFSGPLPSSLTKLTGLVYLNLSLNGFTKKIPQGFELMNNLKVLDLHGNLLEGDLDLQLLLLPNATHIDLSGNLLVSSASLHQKFPPGLSETVKYINLSHNQLTGSLIGGVEEQAFGSLNVLDLSHNQLSGELPVPDFLYDLQVLRLGNNRFSGVIPNNLLQKDSLLLKELDLSGNNLTGQIGTITSTTLSILNLSSNALSGELPLVIGSCAVLDLSNNQFEGDLTRTEKWVNIEFLDLSRNHLTGPIPETTAQLLRLNYLNLSQNALSGNLTSVITQVPKITVIDLSFNQLEGPLLTSILNLPTLKELYLHNNSFSGGIEFSPPSSESNLNVLDISNNRLSGYFPDGLEPFTRLQVVDVSGNNFFGSLPTSVGDISNLTSLDVSRNNFSGPLPTNLPDNLQIFNASYNDFSGIVPENLRKFPPSSFFPGNSNLQLPNAPPGSGQAPMGNQKRKPLRPIIIVVIIVSSVLALAILILLGLFVYWVCKFRTPQPHVIDMDIRRQTPLLPSGFSRREGAGGLLVSAGDLMTSQKGSASEIISPDKKMAPAVTGYSQSKASQLSWSSESGDLSKSDTRSPDQLPGDLYLIDDTISFTHEELSRAPAEVLGRSSHGTSYKATLDNGLVLSVKWLRGVTKPKKEFAKEAKRLASIRHPNVLGLRGYYWGPTQHEKLILSDYVSPGSLANCLYDGPGRKGAPLSWPQRLKIAVDVARGLNYLHFDRETPHGNLKANNILLDGPNLNARVSDYCLHRLIVHTAGTGGKMEQIFDAGAVGYRAPELAASTKLPLPSFKSDVYTFGVILMELLTGKCAGDAVSGEHGGGLDLTDWVRMKVKEAPRGSEWFDTAVLGEIMGSPAVEKQMKDVLGIALQCIQPVSGRPGIKNVYEDLSSI
nr:probable LRR receptor-like serine/threonine-protein kinase At4g20940 [Ipomoea batatas]